MPTENSEIVPGKVFVQTNENEEPKELGTIKDIAEVHNDDAADAMEYAVGGMTSGEISMTIDISKDRARQILKMNGLETITRKRFKKLLMGCGIQRNEAEVIAKAFNENKIKYTPLAVQKVVETIIKEAEKI